MGSTYSAEQVKLVNGSCRNILKYAYSNDKPQSIVMDYILANEQEFKKGTILDFGAGKNAIQANYLRKHGFNITAYDFGDNISDAIDANALSRKYDTIMLSNVLNIQVDLSMLDATLNDVLLACKPFTKIICNYPSRPHNLLDDEGNKVTAEQLKAILEYKFGRELTIISKNRKRCIWVL